MRCGGAPNRAPGAPQVVQSGRTPSNTTVNRGQWATPVASCSWLGHQGSSGSNCIHQQQQQQQYTNVLRMSRPHRKQHQCCSLPQTVNGITIVSSSSSSSSGEEDAGPDISLDEEWQQAEQAAAQQLGVAPSDLAAQRQLLQLLLPDMAATFAGRKAAAAAWGCVVEGVTGLGPGGVDAQEVVLMGRVMEAIRVSPADAAAALAHNQVVGAACQLFNDARWEGRLTPAAKAPLLRLVTGLLATKQRLLVEEMTQQLAVAATSPAYMPALLTLRELLPGADISALMLAHPHLVRLGATHLGEVVTQGLEALSPPLKRREAAALLQAAPFLLEGALLSQVLQELAVLFPEEAPAVMLRRHVHVGASTVLAPYQEAARQLVAAGRAASGEGSPT